MSDHVVVPVDAATAFVIAANLRTWADTVEELHGLWDVLPGVADDIRTWAAALDAAVRVVQSTHLNSSGRWREVPR